ncbi:GNAT family N-acetyltransferase [Erythrobacter sp. KY5]|uniref:GNAT family N-acetyltransferase n=1 Tax=Erythrobacter sp. KY5 TaxID=2011159 RepID=UPI001574E1F0|nr:GNAT family N-acetyltransferase [Erythrobacter sp. KY5]
MPSKPASPIEIHTRLENGNPVCIRTIREDDRELMRAGIAQMSDRSRYLRFFSGARTAPDWVIERLIAADGHDHIAWGAIDTGKDDQPAIGAVHAFRDHEDDDCAEFSVAVLDEYHGLGLGKLLTATILLDAIDEGIAEFEVNMLADNASALDFTRSLGGKIKGHDRGTLEFVLDVKTALARLKAECDPPGMAEVFAAFG